VAEQDKQRREFERYGFRAHVEISDAASGTLIESARLKDVSGGGVSFLSTKPEAYERGQEVAVVIRMPGTDTMMAYMRGHGSVAWVSGDLDGDGPWRVGVVLFDPLRFEQEMRDDETSGSDASKERR
jgi:hypothetical protein